MLAFAELTKFRDMKVKNFSSGMTLRLAFAVTVQVDADILMLDEVLSVGDRSFQSKCMEHFDRLRAEGRTLVLVTHDMNQIERLCDRALLLEGGRIAHIGRGAEVAEAYDDVNAKAAGGRTLPRRHHEQTGPSPPGARRAAGPLVPSSGPSLLGDNVRRLPTLVLTLAQAEFRLRYLDAALSYLWVLMGPLLFSAILYFVFKVLGAFDKHVPHYSLYLLSSLLLWTFFAVGTSTAVTCLVDREPLLRRLAFPRIAIPLSVVLIALFDMAMSSIALLVFVLASGVEPRWTWLELPALVAAETVLITGVSLLLAAAYVRYRDVDHIWILLRQLLFYASGIFFVATRVPHRFRVPYLSNPMAALFAQTRHALIDPHAPTIVQAAGSVPAALIPLAVSAMALVVGVVAFSRIAPSVAEDV
jgi:ABC-2 type transport system permease protein